MPTTTTIKWNWPLLASILTALAGVAGTVLTPIYGSTLSGQVQNILMAISALLLAIPAAHAASAALTRSNMRFSAQFAREQAAQDRVDAFAAATQAGHTLVVGTPADTPVPASVPMAAASAARPAQ